LNEALTIILVLSDRVRKGYYRDVANTGTRFGLENVMQKNAITIR